MAKKIAKKAVKKAAKKAVKKAPAKKVATKKAPAKKAATKKAPAKKAPAKKATKVVDEPVKSEPTFAEQVGQVLAELDIAGDEAAEALVQDPRLQAGDDGEETTVDTNDVPFDVDTLPAEAVGSES